MVQLSGALPPLPSAFPGPAGLTADTRVTDHDYAQGPALPSLSRKALIPRSTPDTAPAADVEDWTQVRSSRRLSVGHLMQMRDAHACLKYPGPCMSSHGVVDTHEVSAG